MGGGGARTTGLLGGGRLTGILQVVRLKGFLQRWRSVAVKSSPNSPLLRHHNHGKVPRYRGGRHKSPPAILNKRLVTLKSQDPDHEDRSSSSSSCRSPKSPLDVPKGYLAVYVGQQELRRFIIPTSHLSHPLFKVILEKVEEEFGFDHSGGLTIPCEIETFKYLLNCMENQHKTDHTNETSAN